MEYIALTNSPDASLVTSVIQGDREAEHHLFFSLCSPMFEYIIYEIFKGKAEKDELVSELYLYLRENDWYRLRQFQFKCIPVDRRHVLLTLSVVKQANFALVVGVLTVSGRASSSFKQDGSFFFLFKSNCHK